MILNFTANHAPGQIKYNYDQAHDKTFDYDTPKAYEIADIAVLGTKHLDHSAIKSLSGLKIGDKIMIPGPKISDAINKLWKHGLMEDVSIHVDKIEGEKVWLAIKLAELPRLSGIIFKGIRKGQQTQLNEEVDLIIGKIINDAMIKNASLAVNKYFQKKGYLNVSVKVAREFDKNELNTAKLIFTIQKNHKIKIDRILFSGNESFASNKLKRKMSQTKEKIRINPFITPDYLLVQQLDSAKTGFKESWWKRFLHRTFNLNIFSSAKFKLKEFGEDKKSLIDFYQDMGYRNMEILTDTLLVESHRRANILIRINEGNRFYIRNITWEGNYKYSDQFLSKVLGVDKGSIYSLENINKRLYFNPGGRDIGSLYMDNGHLMFQAIPVEAKVENDSIDLEIRITEGAEFKVNRIIVKGNELTSDHVIKRELRTLPGQQFSRQEVVRSTQELAGLGFLNPEGINVNPILNAEDGTVDLEYNVEEQSGTELQASMGFDGRSRFYGTMGISLNNFSSRKFFSFKDWQGLPVGDGQKLQISLQSNASTFENYSFSFVEPWFGGKRHNAFSLHFNHVVNRRFNLESLELGKLKLYSGTIGLSKRLRWPDDYFQWQNSITYAYYLFEDYNNSLGISNGDAHSLTFNTTISRYNLDNPQYPRSGSNISLKLSFTPPYSLFNNIDYENANNNTKYKFVEYHKYDFDVSLFTPIVGDLVLHAKASMGFIGAYNSKLGLGPFERYSLGGSGLGTTGDFLIGSNPIGLRGYDENAIWPEDQATGFTGGVVFNKFTFELRYPLSFSPLIYVLGYMEAGNTWNNYRDFNPNQLFKSTGVGLRINLPGMGLLGIDFNHAIDTTIGNVTPVKKNITFTFGGQRR